MVIKISIINRTKLKEIAGELSISGDFPELLEKEVEQIIKKAMERAVANNRKTLMGKDL